MMDEQRKKADANRVGYQPDIQALDELNNRFRKAANARMNKLSPEQRKAAASAGAAARWAKADPERANLPRAEFGNDDRPLKISGMEIPCYVLEDERRVLTANGFQDALKIARGGSMKAGMSRLELFASGKLINPFIAKDLYERVSNPISFITPGGARAYGYEAEILVELCEAVLAARQAGRLMQQQMPIAQQCELIMRGLARVGIVALVDEATGYQVVRKRDALAKILEAYISKELLPWAQRFPLEFYEGIYRLHKWEDLDPASRSKPGYVGKLTNALVYERLPEGVLQQLRTQNPVDHETGKRKFKHHQFLTDEIGNPHLEKHLAKVIGLMQASDSWIEFKRLFKKVFKVEDGEAPRGRGTVRI
ncbi:P63C domain-containing protein [Methylobacterium sp. WL8]|uniref:P63C domain-containing protein n=1 Tax=Methylobacterium sp. WL8 TaxID=2603899 RepID=UPI0011CAC814|nr:P63C domain-containing protein [Methylobacterium sp. WL8]TXN78282.1 hypothetical protein FV234_22980 [Methylobacterium sp. WL8]